MKALFPLLFFSSLGLSTQAQDSSYPQYEHMYKPQPTATVAAAKKPAVQPPVASPEYADTSRVIGFAIAPLYKKQPESPLGNLMADAMRWYAQKMYDTTVDAAFVNFSSLRAYLPKGNITVGGVLRTMPYDNKIVLLKIKGNVLQQFLQHTASLGGWPCSGITMEIHNQTATGILINQQPLSESATYTIAVADYIARGGNQCVMLKGLPWTNKNILFKTAILDYIVSITQSGKPVTSAIEKRVVYIND